MKKRIYSWVLIGALMVSLTACGSSAQGSASDSTSQSSAQESSSSGKVFRIATEDPQVPLDMQQNTYTAIAKITDSVVESLITYNSEGKLVPQLLTKLPDLSEDGLTYSFELRDDALFHNGEKLKSSDVKYSLERVVKMAKMANLLENVEGYDAMNDGQSDELSGIEVEDDTHFKIHMKKVFTPFTSILSTAYCGIYPKDACEEAGDNWGRTVLYGTGPFKLDSYETGSGVTLKKNDDYYGDKAKIDEVDYKFVSDNNTGVLEYQKGNVDLVFLDASLYPTYSSGDLKDEIHSFSPIGGYYIPLNVKEIPEVKVREALEYAIDRDAIAQSVLFGTVKSASSFLQEGLIGYNADAEEYKYDPEKSKQLLAEAGYSNGYDLRLTVNSSSSTSVSVATAIQAQAKDAGFNIEIEQVDKAAWTDMKKNGGIQASMSSWYVDYGDPDSMLYPMSDGHTDLNSSFWHNEEFKECMEKGAETENEDERQKLYARADEILTHEDFAVVMIYNEVDNYLLKPNVKGFEETSTWRTLLGNVEID